MEVTSRCFDIFVALMVLAIASSMAAFFTTVMMMIRIYMMILMNSYFQIPPKFANTAQYGRESLNQGQQTHKIWLYLYFLLGLKLTLGNPAFFAKL